MSSKEGIGITNLIILTAILGGLYFLYHIVVAKKVEKAETTQDVIGKRTVINNEGIIEVDGIFRVCLYATQVNMRTNSYAEKNRVWVSFRSMLNELGIPYTFLQLSQFIDVREYASWYEQQQEKAQLTPELIESGKEIVKFIKSADEDKNSRDYSGYIVFHYDPTSDSIDSGVSVGNAQLDELIRKISGKKSISKAETQNLSKQILTEAVNITRSYAEQIGMNCYQLPKSEVYNLSYRILQKDLSAYTSVEEANQAQSFTPFRESITKKTIQVDLREGEADGVEIA